MQFRIIFLHIVMAMLMIAVAISSPIAMKAESKALAMRSTYRVMKALPRRDAAPPAVCGQVEGSYAQSYYIIEGIKYLKRKAKAGTTLVAPRRECNRISCSWSSAIFVCNDNDFPISVKFQVVVDYVGEIFRKCDYYHMKGQFFDTNNWSVVIRAADC